MVSEKRASKRILSFKPDEITGVCRKLRNWELNDSCCRVDFSVLKYSVVQKFL